MTKMFTTEARVAGYDVGSLPGDDDGKQYSVGQTQHMQLVVLVYTALMRQLKHDRSLDWAHTRLSTIGESCRMILRETLAKTLEWVVERTREGMSVLEIKQRLALP